METKEDDSAKMALHPGNTGTACSLANICAFILCGTPGMWKMPQFQVGVPHNLEFPSFPSHIFSFGSGAYMFSYLKCKEVTQIKW